jgi:kumamolisin
VSGGGRFVPLAGSARPARHDPQPSGAPLDREAPHAVSVLLRPAREQRVAEIVAERAARLPADRRERLRPELDLAPAEDALAAVETFAAAAGLTLGAREGRLVRLEGRLGDLAGAFRVEPRLHAVGPDQVLSHDEPLELPAALARHTLAVLGFDRRPLATPGATGAGESTAAVDPRAVAAAYRFPPDCDGAGERIGMILLGGGVHQDDLASYFGLLGIPEPAIRLETIDPATNDPATPEALRAALEAMGLGEDPVHPAQAAPGVAGAGSVPWTIEATLDVELSGALAPGAALDVVFAPGDIQGKVHAFSRLLTDPRGPAVISCSWGGFESAYRDQDVAAMESLFAEAAARDVTLCFASGDRGDGTSVFGGPGPTPEVFYPGSSPGVVACGGTTVGPDEAGAEISWEEALGTARLASGGGLSARFARPAWQGAELPAGAGRWLPDVAAKANLHGGYRIVAGGLRAAMGGTSAASPLWGALLARCNQALRRAGHGPVGYLTPHLYPAPAGATRDVTRGTNGTYSAGAGWDACTGWGSPDGERLLAFLSGGGG